MYSYLESSMLECHVTPFNSDDDLDSGVFYDYDRNLKIPISKANLIPSFDELESQEKENQEPERIFYNKIDDDLLDLIKKSPYFKITEMVNSSGVQIANHLFSLSHNKQM